MNYLFFDIECANCFLGKGKICSFGYVLCDEHLKVLEQKDILINPKAKFHLGKPEENQGITLAYPKETFLKQPTFDKLYPKIKELLERKDQIVFGHALTNDLNFLQAEFERYKLPTFYIKAYDTQTIYRQLKNIKNDVGLERLCDEYKIEKEALHRSDYDAFITMQVLKHMCKEKECSVEDLIKDIPNSYLELKDGAIIKVFNPTSPAKTLLHYAKKIHMDKTIKDETLFDKVFAMDETLEETDMKRAKKIVNLIRRKGADYTIRVKKCNYFIEVEKDSKKAQKARDILKENDGLFKIINLEELKNILKLEEDL